MAEVRWPSSVNPSVIFRSLQGRASDRKLRLFACAVCRKVWGRLADRRSRRAVEGVEAVDGPLLADAGTVGEEGAALDKRLQAVCDGVVAVVREGLEKVTLAELAKG